MRQRYLGLADEIKNILLTLLGGFALSHILIYFHLDIKSQPRWHIWSGCGGSKLGSNPGRVGYLS